MKLNNYIAIVVLLSLGIVSTTTYYAVNSSKHTETLADKAFQSEHQIARIERIYSIISDADEGLKNYIITGNEKFLVRADSSYAKISRTAKYMDNDIDNDPILLLESKRLESAIHNKLSFMEAVSAARRQSFDSAQKMVLSGQGIALMDSIKSITSGIYKRERTERTQYATQDALSIGRTNFIIILGELIAFLIILFVLVQLNRDMARRMAAEKLLKESEIKYRAIAQNIGSYIYTCDYYGKITFATPNINALTGYTSGELKGNHFTLLVAPEDSVAVENGYYSQFKNKVTEQTSEFTLVTKQGQRKRVKQDVVVFSTEDWMLGFQCTIHDISRG